MHDDLLDAVKWAVDQKIADPRKVAIMGGSYGGYATLVGLTFTPDVFACGVDIVGPSNLVTLLETIPAYWAPAIEELTHRIGDHRTEAGKKFLFEHSALSRVDAIKRPLLIGQGKNDPRVKQAESDQIVGGDAGRRACLRTTSSTPTKATGSPAGEQAQLQRRRQEALPRPAARRELGDGRRGRLRRLDDHRAQRGRQGVRAGRDGAEEAVRRHAPC